MPHSQHGSNGRQTPTQVDSQLRDLRINADSVSEGLESPLADQSGRPRTESTTSKRSAFSVIVEEEIGTSQVGSPERFARRPSHPMYVVYLRDASLY